MHFKNILVALLPPLLLLLLGSCLFDAGAFLGSGSPDERFDKSASLSAPVAPSVIDTSIFSFLVISDSHYGRRDSALIYAEQFRQTTPYEFLVVNGDITQTGETSEWDQFSADRAALGVPAYLTIGNHDLFNDGQENFYSYFGPTHYSLTLGSVLLVFFDTANGVTSPKTRDWYSALLQANQNKKIITFTHYSYLTKKVQQMVTIPNPQEFYWLVDINATFGVEAMISGHLHTDLEQTFRGTYYNTVANTSNEDEDQGLLVTYQSGVLSYKRVKLGN